MRVIPLIPPLINSEHIKEKIICIRSQRERIFRIALTQEQNKLIFHNYGHGGAGWTFLFGSVHESIRLYTQHMHAHPDLAQKPVAVIGAGCYGLLTAITLAQRGIPVRIIAKDIENVSSYKAAGFFFPKPRRSASPTESALCIRLGIESYRTYQQIYNRTHPFLTAGVSLIPAYFNPDVDPGFQPYSAQGLVQPPEPVLIHFGAHNRYPMMRYTLLFLDTRVLMQELHRTIHTLQIPLIPATVSSWEEIPESVIFNCTGLGAHALTGDKDIVPVQGHLITLTNQPDRSQLQYLINTRVPGFTPKGTARNDLIYYAPKQEGILGITFLRGSHTRSENRHEFDRLLERSYRYFHT
jgi:D-amino-acid oxidase